MLSIFKRTIDESRTKEATELRLKFERLMFELGLYNKFNKTYGLYIQKRTNYGFYAKVYLQPGLSYTVLSKYQDIVEENLRCIWIMDTSKFKEYADVRIVTKPLDEKLVYEKPDIKPWEMYLGLNFSLNVIKNNNNDNCMFLIAGGTGSGKTRFIYMILLSWVLCCGVNEVELYISDIAKDEYVNWKYLKHVRYYASELEQLHKMLLYIEKEFNKRKKIISHCRDKGIATNIEEYNKVYKKCKLSYCYILIDEFSILMPAAGEDINTKNMKMEILSLLSIFSKTCRSYGIFPIIATQKTVNDEMPAIIRDMSAVRIAFRANSGKASESIIGDNSAVGLEKRYAVYSLDGGSKKDYLFSPYLTTEHMNELLKPYMDRKRKMIDIDKELSEIKVISKSETKVTNIEQKKEPKRQQYETINILSGNNKEDGIIDY
jgi:hypothetical protein